MIPLYDDNPTSRVPVVTYSIIAACVAIFAWQALTLSETETVKVVYRLGFVPAEFFGEGAIDATIRELQDLPPFLTILTSMFLHGDILHVGGNMLYLWIFGNNVEDSMGRLRFIVFYLVTGAAAALTQGLIEPTSEIPMIGASGAISGVLGAYILLHPRASVYTLLVLGVILTTVRFPAVLVLGFYILLQFAQAYFTPVGEPGVAWWAHIGGFVAGVFLIPFFKSSDVRLFAPPRSGIGDNIRPRRRGPWSQ
jgi:membrane associated rhomboid family serine protease